MNETQRKLMEYLADPKRTEREKVFVDLNYLLYGDTSNADTLSAIHQYLQNNYRNWCDGGIKRAAVFFGLTLKPVFAVGDRVKEIYANQLPIGSVLCGVNSQRSFMSTYVQGGGAIWKCSDGNVFPRVGEGTIIHIGAGK